MSRVSRCALLAVGVCLVLQAPAPAQIAPAYAQLPGADGCLRALGGLNRLSQSVFQQCPQAGAIGFPVALVPSPDGRQLIVAASGGDTGSNALTTFNRSQSNGALSSASCVSEDGGDGRLGSDGSCADADGLGSVNAAALTADGRWLFATAAGSSSLTWFVRDPETGSLEQRGCTKNFAWPGERCSVTPLLEQASGVAVSPDGTLVFVTAPTSGALTVFRRDPETGAIERASCISDTGSDGLCANGYGLRGAYRVAAGSDGHVFVLAGAGAVTSFVVDAGTGAIAERGCLGGGGGQQCKATPTLMKARSMAVSPDGRDLYVGSEADLGVPDVLTAMRVEPDGALVDNGCYAFQVAQPGDVPPEESPDNPSDETDEGDARSRAGLGDCIPTRALHPFVLALSGDGRTLFSTGGTQDVTIFRRDPATGRLEWTACLEGYLGYKACTQVQFGDEDASALAASADGANLYLAHAYASVIQVFAATVGVARSARVYAGARALLRLSCPRARPVACAGALRQGRLLRRAARYRLAPGSHASVALELRASAATRVRSGVLRSLRLAVTDGRFTRATSRLVALREG